MNNVEQLLEEIDATLKANSFITNPDNVYAGEYYDKEGLPDSAFPRLEYIDHGEDNYVYISQATIEPIQWYSITGFIRHEDSLILNQSLERMKRTSRFMRETCASMFQFNLKKWNSTLGVKGFIQVHPEYHLDMQPEVLSRTDSFFLLIGFQVSRAWYKE